MGNKLFLVVAMLLVGLCAKAQDKIYLLDGKIINVKIINVYKDRLEFIKDSTKSPRKISFSEILRYEISDKTKAEEVMKRTKAPVVFNKDSFNNPKVQVVKNTDYTGRFLRTAGGFAIAGSALTFIGFIMNVDANDSYLSKLGSIPSDPDLTVNEKIDMLNNLSAKYTQDVKNSRWVTGVGLISLMFSAMKLTQAGYAFRENNRYAVKFTGNGICVRF